MYQQVKSVYYIPDTLHDMNISYADAIRAIKEEMEYELIKKFPKNRNVYFEVCKPTKEELAELVEHYKLLDGRYYYAGEFKSREFLEEKLKTRDYKIYMYAEVLV
jgi:hypothetical protein